ncbi:hypothetical protein QNI16_34520 [Cytophagaceae bacterium YF14B1]|uniref:SH3b domain-containing protein n=1 Tax=Xanthocytophaga flava TaxID=3048013 RepID=A0AAE3QUE0_9BACT|nr:hypothetical protein [Xanthocytophaga flavus]MDJ1485655.1 hypothetical protein [Xanthocytophaga flavus]
MNSINTMQASLTKKTTFICIALSISQIFFQKAFAVSSIQEGDSLFAKRNYTQALAVYEDIMQRQQEVSSAMLLKMAFITESLGDYTRSLHYLNLYYQQHPSQQAAIKMNEIAMRNNLIGYDYSDWDFFMIFYQRYYLFVVLGLSLLSLWMLAGMIRKKIRGTFVAGRHGLALIFFLGAILAIFNLQFNNRKAIVSEDYSYMMNAPSAGARLVRVIRKGHRVDVQGEQDIWIRTEWAGKPAFIRKQNVWMIE